MMAVAAPAARGVRSRGRIVDTVIVAGLAILAYVPFLASSPHLLSADTKEYLYLDPGRLLSRAPYLWDPHVGMGTVPHQQIGYLFPMGPYFWLMDRVGVPDWIAQRLWLGTISLAAVLGARWLFTMLGTGRAGALAGALVYMLTPYQLAFTARISVILLAWAALPCLVGLTIRAVRNGGWHDPALFALVLLTVGSVNASSLVFVAIAPALWLLIEALGGRAAIRRALQATARIALLSVGVSLWWIVGLRTQGTYGLPVLQLTETLRTVATKSDPVDLMRGLGNWYFYGFDRFGFSIEQAASYVDKTAVIAASFAVPVLALCAAGFVRWRHRGFFAALVVVGTVVGVGAWPYDDPSAYGSVFKWFANDTAAGLALRNTPRVVPVIVLGLAGLLAAGVGALAPRRRDWFAAAAVVILVAIAFAPVWRYGYLSDGVARANDIPDYWKQAAAAMQADGNDTRVLEIPGSDFSAYRWGDTIEPVTPGLIDRPYVAREVLPSGTPPSVNLLVALDHRIQEGTLEPAALAAYARLINVGTISVRSDLAYERFDTPNPRVLWQQLTEPLPPGLRAPRVFGAAVPNPPPPALPELDEPELRTPATVPNPPPVALFEVDGAVPIVHAAPSEQPVVLDGDGEGIVDAIGAGLLDGKQLVFELASLANPQLRRELRAGADLVLTDSNRRRSERWFSGVRDNTGATEEVGDPVGGPGSADYRLDVFPGTGDASRTVVEQHGGHASANAALGPADRAALAFDGDVRTAWRVGGRRGRPTARAAHAERRRARRPRHAGATAGPLQGPRHHQGADHHRRRRADHRRARARVPAADGQVVSFPARTVHKLVIEPVATNLPFGDTDPSTDAPLPTNAVGFAEVKLGDVRIRETVRLPVDFARRIDGAAQGHRIDIVLARLRYDPGRRDRNDEELALDRRFVLPDTRQYQLSGTAHRSERARRAARHRARHHRARHGVHVVRSPQRRSRRALVARVRRQPDDGLDRAARPAGRAVHRRQPAGAAHGERAQPHRRRRRASSGSHRAHARGRRRRGAQAERSSGHRRGRGGFDADGHDPVRPAHQLAPPPRGRCRARRHDERRAQRDGGCAGLDRGGRAGGCPGSRGTEHREHRVPLRPGPGRRPRGAGADHRSCGRRTQRPSDRAVRRRAHARQGQQHGADGRRPRHRDRSRPAGALVGRERPGHHGRHARDAARPVRREGAHRGLEPRLLRPEGAHRRQAVLARARREPQRRVGGEGRRSVARHTAAGERLRERVVRPTEGSRHHCDLVAVDAPAFRVDRLRACRSSRCSLVSR